MKIRNDYVSNSSSSSFIVTGKDVVKAIKMFYEDFKETLNDSEAYRQPLGETMTIGVRYNGDSEWASTDFSDFCNSVKSGEKKFEDVATIIVECDDWDSLGLMYLNFLYLYFKKFGFHPDDSNTEHSFRENDDGNFFLTKILQRLSILPESKKGEK